MNENQTVWLWDADSRDRDKTWFLYYPHTLLYPNTLLYVLVPTAPSYSSVSSFSIVVELHRILVIYKYPISYHQ